METIQFRPLLRSVLILRGILETWGNLLSLSHLCERPLAGMKKLAKIKIMMIIIMISVVLFFVVGDEMTIFNGNVFIFISSLKETMLYYLYCWLIYWILSLNPKRLSISDLSGVLVYLWIYRNFIYYNIIVTIRIIISSLYITISTLYIMVSLLINRFWFILCLLVHLYIYCNFTYNNITVNNYCV